MNLYFSLKLVFTIVLFSVFLSSEEKIQIESHYKFARLLPADEFSDGSNDLLLFQYLAPEDINNFGYFDLINIPDVTPIDAWAVIRQQGYGEIREYFHLKNAPGLNRFAYKSLLDFTAFPKKVKPKKWLSRFSTTVSDLPPISGSEEGEVSGSYSYLSNSVRPAVYAKFYTEYGRHFSAGITSNRNFREPYFHWNYAGYDIPQMKGFLTVDNFDMGLLKLNHLILGNFVASFGQGIVFENRDSSTRRRTNFGFTKRFTGIYPDLSRTEEYSMRGAAIDLAAFNFTGSAFISKAPRDAIINEDGSFSTFIVMNPRLPWGINGEYGGINNIYSSLTGSVHELTWGGNLNWFPKMGARLGFTFFESLYDRILSPQVNESIVGYFDESNIDYSGDEFYLNHLGNSADAEIAAMYASQGTSPLWKDAKAFRRVIGFDFSTVIQNIAIQGEYGELSREKEIYKLGNEPSAFLISAYFTKGNFNSLILYRDYDLEYDNPYQRSFSNYQRYKTTIFEDDYWLEDPIFYSLFSLNPQPQAERGLFVSGYYQFHRNFTGSLNWDSWTRVADNTRYFRTVANLEYRPVFNYRIKLRQKFQGRGTMDIFHPSPYFITETRIIAQLRLSNFNNLELIYSNNFARFSPRPRLVKNAETGISYDMMVGDIGSPEESMGAAFTHHFGDGLTMKAAALFIEGFLWYFEDTDFRIFETDVQTMHSWFSFNTKVQDNLYLYLKVSHTTGLPQSNLVEAFPFDGQSDGAVAPPYQISNQTNFRLQLDYVF